MFITMIGASKQLEVPYLGNSNSGKCVNLTGQKGSQHDFVIPIILKWIPSHSSNTSGKSVL
jgi:hypothetical protein